MNKKTVEHITASDYVDNAASNGPTPRGLEIATMSMSDIPEDADIDKVFNEIGQQVKFARNIVLGKTATSNTNSTY